MHDSNHIQCIYHLHYIHSSTSEIRLIASTGRRGVLYTDPATVPVEGASDKAYWPLRRPVLSTEPSREAGVRGCKTDLVDFWEDESHTASKRLC